MATHGTPISSLQSSSGVGGEDLVEKIMSDYNSQEAGAPLQAPMYDPSPPVETLEEEGFDVSEEYENYVDGDGNYAVEKTVAYEKQQSTLDYLKPTLLVVVLFVVLNLPVLTSIIDPVLERFNVPHLSLVVRALVIGVLFYLVKVYLL